MKKELFIIILNYLSKWVLIRIPLSLLSIIYSIVTGVLLILLFPILYPLERAGIEPRWVYDGNDKIKEWFNEKTKH